MASKIDSKNSDNSIPNRLSRDKDVFVPSTALATSSSIAENRFGRKSRNMFFIRHTAHPKNLRFITACGGIQVCSMKEDNYNLPDNVLEQIKQSTLSTASINPSILTNQKSIENYISDPKYALKFDSNSSSYNQDLLKKYEKKIVVKNRKERILPPIRHWTSTYMLADDTKRWRMELNSLAKKVGIMTNEEVESEPAAARVKQNDQIKIDSLEIRNVKSLEFQRSTTQVNMNTNSNTNNNNNNKHTSAVNRKQLSHDSETTMSSTKEDRVKTGRFNETRGSALASRKQVSSSRLKTSLNLNSTSNKNKFILCIEESEREMWLLQILCQILNTESMQDIQSWLVSSGHQEKEAMKELIQKALDGLNQSGRIDIEKFNITNINPNEKTTQVDFEQIKNSITSMIENNKNIQFSNNNNSNQINNQTNFNNENKPEEISINNNNTTTINNNSNTNTTLITAAATNNSQINQTNINIDLGNENLIARLKLEESKNKKDNKTNEEEEENPFACGSEFKSVSLINMDPYAYERSRTLSTFEHYLSRTTYFQKKLRNRLIIKTKTRNNNIIETPQSATITSTATATTTNVLKHRPASSVDGGNNELIRATSLEVLNNTISKKLLNKFNRIELVDLQSLKFKDDTITTTTTTTTAAIVNSDTNLSNNNSNNEKVKTKKSAKKQENLQQQQQQVIYPTNVKLKLETNKDSQVLTIEDN